MTPIGVPVKQDSEAFFRALIAFRIERGHARVPIDYESADGMRLGIMLIAQCLASRAKTYPIIQRMRLRALGVGDVMEIDNIDNHVAFEAHFAALRNFNNHHGNCDVPADYVTRDKLHLGEWLFIQIQHGKRKEYPENWRARLQDLGVQIDQVEDESCLQNEPLRDAVKRRRRPKHALIIMSENGRRHALYLRSSQADEWAISNHITSYWSKPALLSSVKVRIESDRSTITCIALFHHAKLKKAKIRIEFPLRHRVQDGPLQWSRPALDFLATLDIADLQLPLRLHVFQNRVSSFVEIFQGRALAPAPLSAKKLTSAEEWRGVAEGLLTSLSIKLGKERGHWAAESNARPTTEFARSQNH